MVIFGSRALTPLFTVLPLLLLAGGPPVGEQIGASPPGSARRSEAAARREELARKPAWKWTVEERLAKRFDPEGMAARERERVAEREAHRARIPSSTGSPLFDFEEPADGPRSDRIDGRKYPELYLPFELFIVLLDHGFPPDGQYTSELRGPIEERAAALGFGQDLWPRLEKAAAPLLELHREDERLHRSAPTSAPDLKDDGRSILFCHTRARAMAAAKAEFGEEPFLRLLYEAVAPDLQIEFFPPGVAKDLHYLEAGCQ